MVLFLCLFQKEKFYVAAGNKFADKFPKNIILAFQMES